jgi:hypothetical protein
MSKFVILRIAADGIYEHVGKNAKGYDTLGEATEEVHRMLRADTSASFTFAVFEREAIYESEIRVRRR